MSKIKGNVLKFESNEIWFVKYDNRIISVLDSNLSIIDSCITEDIGKFNSCHSFSYYGDPQIWVNCVIKNENGNYAIRCENIRAIQKLYLSNMGNYTYDWTGEYFYKIPNTIYTFWQDTKDKIKYINIYMLLIELHDTRTIIMKNLLELKRLDYEEYDEFNQTCKNLL